MTSIDTLYGRLAGVTFDPLFSTKKVDGCIVSKKNILTTPFGELIPQFETEDIGRRSKKPVYFFKSGAVKSLPLQHQTKVKTPFGEIPAELITFYESGAIKRIFPLDGKLSGFWSWQNELTLAEESALDTPTGYIKAKLLSLQFYEQGGLKSLTLWPGEKATISTPYGEKVFRKGAAFYENGTLRSFEPQKKTEIPTPIGIMIAFDNEPNGIHGDLNSLQFNKDGLVSGLSTIDNEVSVYFPGGGKQIFKPGVKNNVCGDERKISVPLKIRFEKGAVFFNNSAPFRLDLYSFDVRKHSLKTSLPAYACTG